MVSSDLGTFSLLLDDLSDNPKVLQEIAAARVLVVLCGSEELTGPCFYWGLFGLIEWCQEAGLRGTISSFLNLLGDASALRVNKFTDLEPFRLGICPLSQLVDMFRLHEATDPRDKVYASLGMMSHGPVQMGLIPDYSMDWNNLFSNLVRSIFGQHVKVASMSHDWQEYGRISAKGCIIGSITGVNMSKSDCQVVTVKPAHRFSGVSWSTKDWVLHTSAVPVQKADIICRLEDNTGATVIRF